MVFRSNTPVLPTSVMAGWVTIFLVGTDLFVVSPFLPLIGQAVGRSPQSLTVLMSVFSLVYALACPVQGWLAERFGPKAILIFGVSALALANVYTAFAPGFGHLLASRAMAGWAAASTTPMVYTLTANGAEPARRASRLAVVSSGLIIALILGAPAGLLLGSMTQWRWVFLGLAVLLLAMVPINALAWPRLATVHGPQPAMPSAERLVDAWPFLAGMAAWAVSVYMTYTLLGTALAMHLHLDAERASLVLAAFGFGATIGVLSGGRLADRIGAPRMIRTTFTAMTVMFCLSAAAWHSGVVALFALGLFAVALSAYGFLPAIQAAAACAFTARRPTVFGLMSSALYAGITLGSFVGGVVFDRLSMTPVLLISAMAAALGWVLVGALPKR